VFIEACWFIEHNFLKGQAKILTFIAKLYNLTMIGLIKAFLSKNMTDQGVMTVSVTVVVA